MRLGRVGRGMGTVGRKGLGSALANTTASILDLVAFALVARILAPEPLGIFLIALSVGTIAEPVGALNLTPTIIRYIVCAAVRKVPPLPD